MDKVNIIILVCCIFGLQVEAQLLQWNETKTVCQKELKYSDAQAGELKRPRDQATTQNAKCMLACIMKKSGKMDSNNKFIVASMEEDIRKWMTVNPSDASKFEKAIKNCDGQGGDQDQCVAAGKIHACIIKECQAQGVLLP